MMKGGNAAFTQLLNLPDVRDVSANTNALKAYLDKPFDLIKEHCINDNVLEKLVSICTNGASTNIRCNDSLLARFVEEHSKLY